MKKIFLLLCLSCLFIGCDFTTQTTDSSEIKIDDTNKEDDTTNDDNNNDPVIIPISKSFIKTNGTIFVDDNGDEYKIRGMNFSNNSYTSTNFTQAIGKDHDENSYKELHDLGFNTVRYYLNYRMFESDDNPGVFSEEAFAYMDTEIQNAKNNDMKIIFNMHAPQGGYQSSGGGHTLWAGENAESNQNRLAALWEAFAIRYAEEPTVLGYGLVNEPYIIAANYDEAINKWSSLATKITERIRKHDTKHVIFLERAFQMKTEGGTSISYKSDEGYPQINDSNYAYEIHFYEPGIFTNQGMPWSTSYKDKTYTWPNETDVVAIYDRKSNESIMVKQTVTPTTEYQDFETEYFTQAQDAKGLSNWRLICARVGTEETPGHLLIDSVSIIQKDTNQEESIIFTEEFIDSNGGFGSSGCKITNEDEALKITESTGYAQIINTTNQVVFKEGHSYKIRFKIKGEVTSENPSIRIEFIPCTAEIRYHNAEFLDKNIEVFSKHSKEFNVPFYVGEFGMYKYCFYENGTTIPAQKGGSQYVKDIISVFNKYNLAYSYHCYHEDGFGLYRDAWTGLPSEKPETRIEELYEAFREVIK